MPTFTGRLALAFCFGLLAVPGPAHAQDSRVTFSIGTRPVLQSDDAAGYARYYLNYIAHAVESYRELDQQSPVAKAPGYFNKFELRDTTAATPDDLRYSTEQRLTLRRWQFVGGYSGVLLCKFDKAACLWRFIPARGLAYQFWKRKDCSRIAIVFRGTDPTSFTDWYSNFRWATRVLPFADEYDMVRLNINEIVDQAQRLSGCSSTTPIFTVGHSLGGGLAQLAGYSHGRVRRVYAFNSSPVTAIYDVDQALLADNRKGLIIDRVYEKGEILALPRRLTEFFFRPTECDPQIRTAEFNTVTGRRLGNNPVAQHSIDRLWSGLSDFARTATGRPRIPGLTNRDRDNCNDDPTRGIGRTAHVERKQRSAKNAKKKRVEQVAARSASPQYRAADYAAMH